MLVKEIMKRQVVCLSARDTVRTAAQKMRDLNVGFLPVCDPITQEVIGTLTDRDIAIRLVPEDLPAGTKVTAIMTHGVVACLPEDDVITAERIMGQRQKSRILCIDAGGRALGVISLSDLARRDRGERVAETMRQISDRESLPH